MGIMDRLHADMDEAETVLWKKIGEANEALNEAHAHHSSELSKATADYVAQVESIQARHHAALHGEPEPAQQPRLPRAYLPDELKPHVAKALEKLEQEMRAETGASLG
jgi:hypothetical protein